MAPGTHSGMFFNKGTRKLTLGKEEINMAIEFPEDFEFKGGIKGEKRFLKSFIDDVTRFDEKIQESTQQIYDEATRRIATWILEDSGVKNQKTSVFSPEESIGNLKTALVQCNFTDIHRMTQDFRLKLYEDDGDFGGEVTDFLVTEEDSIHSIIDRICETKSGLCVILIRQFESLRPQLLDSLISLIYSNRSIRPEIPRLRLVVCLSTSPEFFKQTCSMSTLNQMDWKMFEFTKLDEIFSKVISTGIHSKFLPPRPKARNVEEDDPNQLNTLDIQPGVFSGQFLKYLQNRFFACDYSVDALIRAVQFSLLQKYLEDPLWREDSHDDELKKYDKVLQSFKTEFWEKDEISLHIEIQSDPKFWEKIKEDGSFRERKQFLFEGPKKGLTEFAARILEDFREIDEDWCQKLEELMEKLEEAPTKMEPSSSTTNTPARKEKVSFLELQKQRRSEMAAKQNNPVRAAKNAICAHVMSLFERILQPYHSTWRNVIGAFDWSSKYVKTSLDSSDEHDIEKCLLNDPLHVDEPLSIAWRSLLTTGKFKTVSMADWAAEFLSHTKTNKKLAKGAFFAAAGQLEHIGLIRGAADRKSTNVNVLYHPISYIPDI